MVFTVVPITIGHAPRSTSQLVVARLPNSFILDPAQVIIVQGDSFTGVPTSLPSEQNLGWGGINNPKVSRCRNVGNKPAILPWTQVSGLAIVLKGGETDEVEAVKACYSSEAVAGKHDMELH